MFRGSYPILAHGVTERAPIANGTFGFQKTRPVGPKKKKMGTIGEGAKSKKRRAHPKRKFEKKIRKRKFIFLIFFQIWIKGPDGPESSKFSEK